MRALTQGGRVRLGHIVEAGKELRLIRRGKGICPQKVDVILDEHEITHIEIGVDATSGIRHHKLRDPQPMHEANGKRNLLRRVPLVGMQPSLHTYDRTTGEQADDKTTRMRWCR